MFFQNPGHIKIVQLFDNIILEKAEKKVYNIKKVQSEPKNLKFCKEGVNVSFLSIAEYEKIIYRQPDSPFVFDVHRKINAHNHVNLAWHEEMEIKHIRSGSMSINMGTKTIHVEKGDIVIMNPYEYHANILGEGEEVEYDLLCVNLSRIFNKNSFEWDYIFNKETNVKFKNIIKNDELLTKMTEQLFDSCQNKDKLFTIGIFIAFFSCLQKHTISEDISRTKKDSRNSEIINNALAYIHAHFDERIKLSELAKECYVSEPHFCRVFKTITGETAITYINNFKITKAISLMKNTSQTTKQIAEAVGFDDVAYFCRCFKKKTGVSPKMFLKQ